MSAAHMPHDEQPQTQAESSAAQPAGCRNVQLKRQLRGASFEEGEAMLAPPGAAPTKGPVQKKRAGVPAAADRNPHVLTSWHLQAEHAAGRASIAELKRHNEVFGRIWNTTRVNMAIMEKEIAALRSQIVRADWFGATLTTFNNWGRAMNNIVTIMSSKDVVTSLMRTRASLSGLRARLTKRGKNTGKAARATGQHGKDAFEGANGILDAGTDPYRLLRDPTQAPSEEEAVETLQGALDEVLGGLDPEALGCEQRQENAAHRRVARCADKLAEPLERA